MFCIRNVLSLASGVHANVVFLVSSKSLGYIQRPELTVRVSSVSFSSASTFVKASFALQIFCIEKCA